MHQKQLINIADQLNNATKNLAFSPPVAFVYRPLDYAWGPHEAYLWRFGAGPKEVLLVGMNPGPFGMAQTGVPFGDVELVREWMGLDGGVGRPNPEHPKRPVRGFDCPRGEVSGRRLWGWARDRFGPPDRFFARFFVWNYCPLVFMETSGRNRTPEKLPAAERAELFAACDAALARVAEGLEVEFAVGIGTFAEDRLRAALPAGSPVTVGRILHPSPANPLANRGWAEAAEAQLARMGVRC